MKYRIKNQLDIFEFHDSKISLVSFNGDELVVSANNLNIHKNTEHNPLENDREIEKAIITFIGFHVPSFGVGREWKLGLDRKPYPVGAETIYYGKEAQEKIIDELQNQIDVFDFGKKDDTRYFIDAIGKEPFFTMEFCFDSVIVEWDEYKKEAWYERHKQKQYEITLATPDGEQRVNVQIVCHNEDVYLPGELQKSSTVNVGIKYDRKQLWGHGNDFLWVDAFADLQKQLPDGVRLKCCLTCRHGNMCPVGNQPGELFCTKDVTITQKSDLFFYTEDYTEREKRSRQYTFVCEDFQLQNDECYTYNDYFYYLR